MGLIWVSTFVAVGFDEPVPRTPVRRGADCPTYADPTQQAIFGAIPLPYACPLAGDTPVPRWAQKRPVQEGRFDLRPFPYTEDVSVMMAWREEEPQKPRAVARLVDRPAGEITFPDPPFLVPFTASLQPPTPGPQPAVRRVREGDGGASLYGPVYVDALQGWNGPINTPRNPVRRPLEGMTTDAAAMARPFVPDYAGAVFQPGTDIFRKPYPSPGLNQSSPDVANFLPTFQQVFFSGLYTPTAPDMPRAIRSQPIDRTSPAFSYAYPYTDSVSANGGLAWMGTTDRPMRPPFRAQVGAISDTTLPWAGSIIYVLAGPFLVTAGQVLAPGAVAGQVTVE